MDSKNVNMLLLIITLSLPRYRISIIVIDVCTYTRTLHKTNLPIRIKIICAVYNMEFTPNLGIQKSKN